MEDTPPGITAIMSRGSLLELETQLLLCARLGYFNEQETSSLTDEIQQISKMLFSLMSKLR